MNPAQYTLDAICSSMGLPAFVEPAWSPPTLRLLLKPSFDPEVCITLTGPAERARLSVVALARMLWRQPAPCALPAWRFEAALPDQTLSQALVAFGAAVAADRQLDGRMVCIADGMPVAACLLSDSGLEQLTCDPHHPATSAFVSSLIQIAWDSCRAAGVRNALAACGRYVGLNLPKEPSPPVAELVRVAILGTPDSRVDYFGLLSIAQAEPG